MTNETTPLMYMQSDIDYTASTRSAIDSFMTGDSSTQLSTTQIVAVLAYIIMGSLQNPTINALATDGKFPFLWSNFYMVVAVIAATFTFRATNDPFKNVTFRILVLNFVASLCQMMNCMDLTFSLITLRCIFWM